MKSKPSSQRQCLSYLILVLIIANVNANINSVSVSPLTVNSIATYTWSITLTATTTSLTLTFPTQVSVLSNCTVTVNGATPSFSRTTNTVTITSSLSGLSLSVIVSNVQNPPSAIATFSFSYLTSASLTVSMALVNQIQYQTGTLSSCPWSFSLCTEQANSDLSISFTTTNKLLSGNNYFLIGFSSLWPNHQSKGLVTSVSAVTCSYSVNSSSFSPVTSCTIDTVANQINALFSLSADMAAGTSLVVKISGVVSPPTKTVTTSSTYYIYTADNSQNKVDGLTSCAFNSVCVTNETSATFSNTATTVSTSFGDPTLTFPTAPLIITIQPSDTIEVYYSPFSSLMTCSTFKFYRSSNPFYSISSPTTSSNYITFTYTQSANTQHTSPFNLILSCSSFLLPPSQTPTVLSFIFKRNSLQYLHLNATITATAATFNSSKGTLVLTSTVMNAVSNFTFNFLLSKQLGSSPAIKITFPTDFTIGTSVCSCSISGIAVSSVTCSVSSKTVTVNLTTSSSLIPANSNVTLIIEGVTNPCYPKTYSFQMDTYYDSAINTSRVETSSTAFTKTITQITNYPVTLSPTGLTVYTTTTMVLTFTSTIPIPIFTNFSIEFPSNVSSIAPNTNLFAINGSAKAIDGNPNTLGTVVTFVSGFAVAIGDIVSISIPLKTPSNIGTYSFVKLIVSYNSTNYLSSQNSLFLNVNAVSSMGLSLTPVTSIAGSLSSYILILYLTIPHSNSFIVQIDVPLDTTFNSTNSSCTSCSSSIVTKNSTSIEFTAINSGGTSATSITFTLSSFVNPRSTGSSLSWGISTKTVTGSNLISYQTITAAISSPNTLTAVLSKSDSYYRNNTSPVKMTFKFTNSLASGDSIQFSTTTDVYSAVSSTSVTCSSIYGVCTLVSSSNVTVIKITPDVSSIINNTYFVILEGLISGSSSNYLFTYNIYVTTMTSNSSSMDSGTMIYNVSCGQNSTNNCKRCYNNGSCIDCYLTIGYYLLGSKCVSQCGTQTSYVSYASNSTGTCTACINNCKTCDSETYCRSCINNYYLYPDSTCKISCLTTSGYYSTGTAPSNLVCAACTSNCLQCVNGSNSCTRCDSATTLINGACSTSGCGSTNYYQLNGQCLLCDSSCYNCSGPGSGSCYVCNSNYHKYLTLCVSQCPTGTAINPSTGDCGCDATCLTCSTYTACTACFNSSNWVMNGACISSCPTGTYANLGQCITCTSGCQNCTINSCLSCVNGSYLYNNLCYSDCNLISQQYDNSGTTCTLCPSGCDRCSSTTCTSCLSDYTMSNSQCIKTCLLDNSCDTTTQVLPMPGLISLVIWIGISIIIHAVFHKNYLPYSIMILSGIIQFVLMVGLLSSLGSTTSRLLATSNQYVGQMRGLLATGIALNYLQNITYIFLFIFYIKPLITNPRQIDVISNITVLIIALATNFRFGLIAFSRMFPKPNIYVNNASKLTPIHYLCIVCMFLDIIILAGCGIGLVNSKKLSDTFMLSIDLLIVILVNYTITIFFVSTTKPDSYYDEFVKKYHIQQNIHQTETLGNEKNVSKAKMAHQSFNFDQFQHTQNEDISYNKLNREQDKIQMQSNNQSTSNLKENVYPVTIHPKPNNNQTDPDPFVDPNFEVNLKSKRNARGKDSIMSSKVDLSKSFDNSGKSMDDNLSTKKNQKVSNNLGKEALRSQRKKVEPQKNILQVQQSDYPDLEEDSTKGNKVFNSKKQKLNKPKKIKESKPPTKPIEEPLKIMKKGDKIGYFQSDAYDSNIDGQDLQQIIKQKIFQSASKVQKRSMQSFKDSNEETGHEQISPSWFNIQNQRLDITDLEESDPQQ